MAFVSVFCKGDEYEPLFNIQIRLEDVNLKLNKISNNENLDFKPEINSFVTMNDPLYVAIKRMEVGI